MNPAGSSTKIKRVISQLGRKATIMRHNSGGTDRLNHSTGSYEMNGTEICAYHSPDGDYGQSGSGELSITTPGFLFFSDANVRVNDRIVYDGTSYEIQELVDRPSHKVATAKQVQ